MNSVDIPSAAFEGYYDQQGQYWLHQYVDSRPQVVNTWKLAQGGLARAAANDAPADIAEPESASAMRREISADTRQLTDQLQIKVSTISSENVWCKLPGCGALAFSAARNAVATPESGVEVPEVCTEHGQ